MTVGGGDDGRNRPPSKVTPPTTVRGGTRTSSRVDVTQGMPRPAVRGTRAAPRAGPPPVRGEHAHAPPRGPGAPMAALPESALRGTRFDARKVAPPKARDSRMDRRVPKRDPHWLFVMVPTDPSRPVERVQLPARQIRRWKVLASVASVLVVVLGVALAISLPSSVAYTSLRDENLDLKQRLEQVDRKMVEVDRMILRLRLYDAQLEGLSAPLAEHGPLPDTEADPDLPEPDPMGGGDDLDPEGLEGEDVLEEGFDEASFEDGDGDEGIRTAAAWADGIVARAQEFLDLFSRSEGQFSAMMEQMEQLESLERALPSLWPATGPMNSGYGFRRNPFGRTRFKFHTGLDVGGKVGTPIYAAASGTVLRSGWFGGYGLALELSHGYGVTTLYGHTSKILVRPGQEVKRGEQIALMGNTGRSTGPHLHFEVRHDHHPVDPLLYLDVPAYARRKVRTWSVLPPGAQLEAPVVNEDEHEE